MSAPWLKDPQAVPYSRINYAAVGLKEIDKGQLHASILYQGSAGKLCGLHLCWHYLGKHEEPAEDGYFWVQLGLPKSKAKSLASFCRLMADKGTHGEIPFAFGFDESVHFDGSDGTLKGADGQGLTCATFVLAVFASIGMRLVANDTWQHRPCDGPWQQKIIKLLAKDDALHAGSLQQSQPVVRYRPEEVAAAAAQSVRPVPFAVAVPGGRSALERMGKLHLACWHDDRCNSASGGTGSAAVSVELPAVGL